MLYGKIGSICVAVFLSCAFLSGSSQVVQISVNAENQHDPAIHESTVVWEDERNENFDIYGFNMLTSEEFQITENASNQYDPAIYGNIVVWMDERNGNYDIYGSNLSSGEEFQVTTNGENQIFISRTT